MSTCMTVLCRHVNKKKSQGGHGVCAKPIFDLQNRRAQVCFCRPHFGPCWVLLSHLAECTAPCWAVSASFWPMLGRCWVMLGNVGPAVGPDWAYVEPFWGELARDRAHVEPF